MTSKDFWPMAILSGIVIVLLFALIFYAGSVNNAQHSFCEEKGYAQVCSNNFEKYCFNIENGTIDKFYFSTNDWGFPQ